MTLRIEESWSTETAVVRLIGRLGGEHLEKVERRFDERQRKSRAGTSGGMNALEKFRSRDSERDLQKVNSLRQCPGGVPMNDPKVRLNAA